MVVLEIFVVLALTVLNGVFAMSELALVSSRKARLSQLAERHSRGARVALRLIDDPGRFLATVQIGITLIGIFAGAFGGATLAARLGAWLNAWPAIAPHGHSIALALVVVAITYLSLIVGELVPKRVALRAPERVAALIAPPMLVLAKAASPAVWLLKVSTDAVLRLLRLHTAGDATISEEEVKSLIAEGVRAGTFVPEEREMIEGVLRLADRRVRVIMTPRSEIVWLDERDTSAELARKLQGAGFSRYPVCRGSVDHVLGIVRTADLLEEALKDPSFRVTVRMSRPLVIPDTAPVLRVLDRFRHERVHMAVVVDEYGVTEGIVTLTDVLESIAGEFPGEGEALEPGLVRRDDGSWLVDGSVPVDEFEDRTGLRGLRRDPDFHTVAGLVLHHLGRLPTVGEHIELPGARFEVVDMDGRRIDRVLVQPVQEPEEGVPAA